MCQSYAEYIVVQMNFLSNKRVTILFAVILIVVVCLVIKNDNLFTHNTSLRCGGRQCNVVLIVSDTLSAQHMSVYGYKHKTTPFMDDFFGNKGIVYENAYSNATWTLPSFASMFRSRYASEIKLAEIVQKAGKETFLSNLREAGVNIAAVEGQDKKAIQESVRNVFLDSELLDVTGDGEVKYRIFSDWINKQKTIDKPFFAFMHEWNVHDPYNAPTKYAEMFDGKKTDEPVYGNEISQVNRNKMFVNIDQKRRFVSKYDQEVRYQDDMLRDFVNSLDLKILNNTIFIFTADHGEAFYEHDGVLHNKNVYNETIKVPLLIHLPFGKNQKISRTVSLIDLGPTVLSLFRIQKPDSFKGKDLRIGKANIGVGESRLVVSELGKSGTDLYGGSGIKDLSEMDILTDNVTVDITKESFIFNTWKFVRSEKNLMLFNLEKDSEEKKDLLVKMSDLDKEGIYLLLKNIKRFNL